MPTPAPFARSHAVVIGINAYGTGITPLRTATNDAARLAGILRDGHGYVDYSYINHLVVNDGVIACGFGEAVADARITAAP